MSDTSNMARAINLARKYSANSENEEITGPVSEGYCSALLKKHVPADFEFPKECSRFGSFRSGIVRRDSKQKEEDVAFAGMDPGAAIKARSAREQGHPNQAQLIRRMSSRSKSKESSWFS
mmetsp:Transcript_30067/g.64434  ORF Transcript_30067/g.64434 Transcript_30067/m.64434 type:complete len:120 (+) Transcript_30067:229-588(+)